jgi:uncharacterized OB-fold protein
MMGYEKTLPGVDAESRPFWEAAREHRLLLQRCRSCGTYQFYHRLLCKACWGEVEPTDAQGTGVIYSFSVIHRAITPAWEQDLPYVVALVDLTEGVRLMTHIVDSPPESIRIGMPVQVAFADLTEEITLPQFRPQNR